VGSPPLFWFDGPTVKVHPVIARLTCPTPTLLKADLRKLLHQRRAREHRQLPKAGEALAMRVPQAVLSLAANTVVTGYVPMLSEIEPGPIMGRFLRAGCSLALPVVTREDAVLVFHAFQFGDALTKGMLGTLEPDAGTPIVEPDILLIPLLGFDRFGARIGMGGGYYDRTLTALRSRKEVLAIGLAFEGQRLDQIPREPHDAHLDWIMTENAAYRAVRGEED
jgi:5-formyltetrahydrofolate cyclo-ligase